MIKMIVIFCILVISVPVTVSAESIGIEAAKVIRELVKLSDVHLTILPEEGLEDVPEQCRITNFQIESIIRGYAYTYKGGKTPMYIARALDDLMHTLDAIIDITNDGDGILSAEEKMYWTKVVSNRNSLFLLWCLHQGYKDVPR